jgi:hypothetical protein
MALSFGNDAFHTAFEIKVTLTHSRRDKLHLH